MIRTDIYWKLKNGELGIKPSKDRKGRDLVKILKEHNLIDVDDLDWVELRENEYIYIRGKEWLYGCYEGDADNVISYKEFIDNYFLENTNSDKKDLIRILIDEYLLENEISIREELLLRRFQDYCLEKLGDDVNGLVNRNEKE